ncbi:hypothetical protein T02_12830 [Trichinella nativa]|uniref:Uncharacterized protein n=1 Tax=Trichinella nativa TaxID=6335 RepID=A0A0V1KKL2_9BILA|nr:hypothetical protein T02_12830 [Trichinella nativa]
MLVSRVWFTNNNRREQKETINQLTISAKCEATHHPASIKAAVAGERAQWSFDVVFGVVVALRRSCKWMGSHENGE